ncbi:MAG TPA: thermonuclease family protein [Ohtaekwangia sp.]
MKPLLLFFICLIIFHTGYALEEITGKVVSVIDGNTIEVKSGDNEVHQIVLKEIDCPELTQEFGEDAKKYLEKIILNKKVTVSIQGKDRWGNRLAIVLINGNVDPRVALLKEGLAWTSEKNPNPDLEPYRSTAQQKGKGLWQQENPTPPWTYRRQQTMLQPKSS